MFGMSSEEFWEQDPQLYWAFRTFYLKQKEIEQIEKMEYMKYTAWLNGNLTHIAVATALNNAFNKSKKDFPKYDEVFINDGKKMKNQKKKEDINTIVQQEFNSWARM